MNIFNMIGSSILLIALIVLGGIALYNYCIRLDYEKELKENKQRERKTKMIKLCVDKRYIKKSDKVQSDIDLAELMEHTIYEDPESRSDLKDYVPLDFCVSIRSMYSNLVVETTTETGNKICYTNLKDIREFIHKGYDLVMYLSSLAVLHCVDYKSGFDKLMFSHSQIQPIGLYNPDPDLINPILYTHIILSDEGAEEFKSYLKDNCKMIPIKDIQQGSLKALVDTLIIVKEENKDVKESDDNN